MYKKSQIEALIEDAEVALDALDRVHVSHDIDFVVSKTDRLIANAKLMGLNKQDGQTLADYGLLEQSYVNALTEYRDAQKGEAIGFESDEGGLISKLLVAAVVALGILLAYIVGKIIGFIMGFFGVGGEGGSSPETKAKAKVKEDIAPEHQDKATEVLAEAFVKLLAMTPHDLLQPKTVAKYAFLKFSKKAGGDPSNLVDILAEATKLQGAIESYAHLDNMTADEIKDSLEDLKTKPRKEVGAFLDVSVPWLDELYGKLKLDPTFSALSTQLQVVKSYKGLKDYVWVNHDYWLKAPLEQHHIIPKDFGEDLKKNASKAKDANDRLAKSVKAIKTPDRTSKAAMATIVNLAIKDPLDFSTRVLSKGVISPILKRLAWQALLQRILERQGGVITDVIIEASKLEGFSTVKDYLGCIKLLNEKGGVISAKLKPYEAQLRPAPKNLNNYLTNVTEVIV